jgi:spore coat polysaccharide biosynthesis predicted glycosyltransferase SpsG
LKKVCIVTEGGKHIGLGHVRRCIVIAHELVQKDIEVIFYVNRELSGTAWIKKEGFQYKTTSLPRSRLLNTTVPHNSLILIDTKKQVSGLIRSLKKRGHVIVLLDNISDAMLEADCIIYPTAIYENNMRLEKFKGRIFGGSKYIPISRSFIGIRGKTINKHLRPPYQVLITMGGSDPNRLTGKIVSALLKSYLPLYIRAVIGPAFSTDPLLAAIGKSHHHNVQFIKGKDDLSAEMAGSHIAITALGTTIFELASLGVPALIIANFRTDDRDMAAFQRLGIALPVGYYRDVRGFDIRNAVESLLINKVAWENMSQKGKILIDGKGADRIAAAIDDFLNSSNPECIPGK